MENFRVSAPTRVDLAGGTLDLWPIYCLLGESKTINLAISLSARVEVEVSAASKFEMELVNGLEKTTLTGTMLPTQFPRLPVSLRFPCAVVSEFLRNRENLPSAHFRLNISSEAPLKSGLGGSSTLCVALVRTLGRIFSDFVGLGWQWAMLNWVKDVEAGFIKAPTGTQDYLAALFGGLRCYVSRVGGIQEYAYPAGVLEELSEHMLVLFSGEMHESGLSNWEIYRGALEGNDGVVKGLKGIRSIADQLDNELKGHLSWKHIGGYLNEEWDTRRTAFKVHTERLDEILEFLRSQKVLGARVCGAAQGGSLLVLVDRGRRKALAESCRQKGIRVLDARAEVAGVTIQDA